jgi:gamma-glutamyltranspeptidase/glutathione hydrolase
VQVACALIDDGADPQSALNRPRFCIEPAEHGGATCLEEGLPRRTIAALGKRGHPVRVLGGWERALFGRGQVIVRERNGTLIGGSDARADGVASAVEA